MLALGCLCAPIDSAGSEICFCRPLWLCSKTIFSDAPSKSTEKKEVSAKCIGWRTIKNKACGKTTFEDDMLLYIENSKES